jgi:HAD superfamily hydrolase (TIGR01509 family)
MEVPFLTIPGSCSLPRTPREVLSLREGASAAPQLISALVFDLDHVLYDASPWQRWLVQLLARVGLHTHYQAFYRAFERDHLQAVYRGEQEYWEALSEYLLAAGLPRARVDEVLAAGHGKYHELWEDVRPLPGVATTLAQLAARGVRLAVLSNSYCSAERIVGKLTQLGLASRFEVVLSSYDLRAAKPAPLCYQAVLTSLKLDSADVGFVGHAALELAGAGLAGMATFAINYSPEAQADVYLDRFDRLLATVSPRMAHQRTG